jgi:methylated-DNA-[protein]-cysteine S-methyltransferase
MESPLGPLTVVLAGGSLRAAPEDGLLDPSANARIVAQIEEYFSGERRVFDLPVSLDGTPFQMAVWKALARIPYGETRSYGQIAEAVGRPGAARAVGMANHANPIPIVIPCHRVIGHDGSLTGYGGGLDIKARLLSMEGAPYVKENRAARIEPRGRFTVLAEATH